MYSRAVLFSCVVFLASTGSYGCGEVAKSDADASTDVLDELSPEEAANRARLAIHACQLEGGECPAPNAPDADVFCCPIAPDLGGDRGRMVSFGGARIEGDYRHGQCRRHWVYPEDRDDYALEQNSLGCMVWAKEVESESLRDTTDFTDGQMIACQNDSQPCPSPVVDGLFCCRVVTEPTYNCTYEGGPYDPSGNVVATWDDCQYSVCDVPVQNIEHYRDPYGCVRAKFDF